jgi:integrase/recombinase XerD
MSTSIVVPPERHPVGLYLGALAPSGRSVQQSSLAQLALRAFHDPDPYAPWWKLGPGEFVALRAYLAENRAPATANRVICALRGVLDCAVREGLLSPLDRQRIRLQSVPGSRPPAGRYITAGELVALFGTCDPRCLIGARDVALLSVLYAAGLRVSEACTLQVGDWNAPDAVLRVLGKGNHVRLVPVPQVGAREALGWWLGLRGTTTGPLLCAVQGTVTYPEVAVSRAAFAKRLLVLAGKAHVTRLSPHDLRRSFVSDLLAQGADLALAQRLAGHRSMTTTGRYDRRPDALAREASARLHVPFAAPSGAF